PFVIPGRSEGPDPESRGSGFARLSSRPGTTVYLNLRADFLISSSEKNISLAWVTISSAFHPVNGGVQPSISIMRISRTPRGPETPSTLPVWSPDKSLTMYSTAGAIPSGPNANPGFSLYRGRSAVMRVSAPGASVQTRMLYLRPSMASTLEKPQMPPLAAP